MAPGAPWARSRPVVYRRCGASPPSRVSVPSTRIEGSKLSDRDAEQLLSTLEIKSFGTRDEQEVAGDAEVMGLVFSSRHDIPFTENHIKQLHQILLCYAEKDTRHRGNYKTHYRGGTGYWQRAVRIAFSC